MGRRPPRAGTRTRSRARQGPRGHWWLTGLVVTVALLSLLAHGLLARDIGVTGTRATVRSPSADIRTSGAVLDLSRETPTSNTTPSNTIALTFDDGPDLTWTPQVLAVLAKHHVTATFFVVGAHVLEHPEITRQVAAAGHEIGVHTFSHADLLGLPAWQRHLQMSLTQTAIAGIIGIRPVLFRPPYSSTPAAVTTNEYGIYRTIGRLGYLIALSDYDSEDWRRPGVASIVRNATPPGDRGGIVLFHDSGGDRAQTVQAVDQYLTTMTARGYRFTTVSELAGLSRGDVAPAAPSAQRFQGHALRVAISAGSVLAAAGSVLLPLLGILLVLRTIILVAFAWSHRRRPERDRFDPAFTPRVTIVVPAYNEAAGIAEAVTSLATGDYPDLLVIVVDDGSTDGTAQIVGNLGLANVTVLSGPNQGKPGALNTGVRHAVTDLIITVDGDTVFEPDTVRWLVQPFADPGVGAVSGNTKVANRRGILGRWQHIEYVMGFNLDRRMYELARCMPTVPGAIGAFRRQALADAGGVSDDTLAEDTDLTMAISRAGWHIVYEERARAWTEVPSTLRQLWRQRYRWSYGTMQSMWKHRAAMRPSERSALGRRAIPYMLVFQILFPVLAPLIDVFAVYGLLFLDRGPVVAYWLGFSLLQLAVAIYAFRLDRESLRPLWTLPLQQVVYRQLMYLVVIQSVVSALVGSRLRWQRMDRTGDFSAAPTR